MSKILALLAEKIIIPLVLKLADKIVDAYVRNKITKDLDEIQKEKAALMKSIQRAQSNDERKALSITLNRLNKL